MNEEVLCEGLIEVSGLASTDKIEKLSESTKKISKKNNKSIKRGKKRNRCKKVKNNKKLLKESDLRNNDTDNSLENFEKIHWIN